MHNVQGPAGGVAMQASGCKRTASQPQAVDSTRSHAGLFRNAIIFTSILVDKVARRAFTTPEPEHAHSLGRKRSTCTQLGKEMQERNNGNRPDRLTGGVHSPQLCRECPRALKLAQQHTRGQLRPLLASSPSWPGVAGQHSPRRDVQRLRAILPSSTSLKLAVIITGNSKGQRQIII